MILEQLLGQIHEEYGLGLQKVGNIHSDKFFPAKSPLTLLRDCTEQLYVLKRIPPAYLEFSSPQDYFHALSLFINQVRGQGIPLVNYLLTTDGKISLLHGTEHYVVYPFTQGEPYSADEQEIRSTASVHAHMNGALDKMLPPDINFVREKIRSKFLSNQQLQLLFEQLTDKLQRITESLPAQRVTNMMPLVREYLNVINEKEYRLLPAGVAHKDVWPPNVIYEQNQLKILLDPDSMMYIPRVRDVSYSIWCFSSRTPDGKATAPDMVKADAYLDSYLKKGTLTSAEIKVLPEAAIRVWIEDFLHFMLNVDLSLTFVPGLEEKIADVSNAVATRSKWRL